MKNLMLTVLLLGSIIACNTNNELELAALSNEAIFTKVDQQPTFNGGMPAYIEYLQNNSVYPAKAKQNGVEGKVFIEFIITKTGQVESARVLRGIEESCDKVALELISNSPAWNPGTQKGVSVNVKMVLPVTFSLQAVSTKVNIEVDSLGCKLLEHVDKMPEYKGGNHNFYKYVLTNLEYPAEARRTGIEGKVFVQFIVSKNGTVKEAKVLKGISTECDKAALDIIKNSEGWLPGEFENKPVDVQMVLPIVFKLG